ncbi:bacteriocin secretion accessory protein [Enterococcus faecalis]|uniref:bacteriocin secretion accessory protein n=1 Tax=Enterococcus faecalis TaxID=1351 RepID=UPI002FBEED81
MEKNNWLDHSSIYSQQHNRFYRWILYPVLLLFLLIGLFLVFAKREVVIRAQAQVTALSTEKLQVPIEGEIKENRLHENLFVKKGDTLIIFDTETLSNEKVQLEAENETMERQKEAAQLFIDSLNKGINLFIVEDSFGYSNQLKGLLAEKDASESLTKQSIETNQKEQEAYQKTKDQLSNQLTSRQNEQNEWEQVRTAWSNQENIQGFSTDIQSKYQSWQAQLKDSAEEQKAQLKATTLATIDDLIAQLEKEIEQLQGEQAKLVRPVTAENEISSQHEKAEQSKEQALAMTKQKILELNELKKKNEKAVKNLNQQIGLGTLRAKKGGIVHLNEEVEGQTALPKGTLLGELYPELQKEEVAFTALIPANEMTRVKTGMQVHFKLDKKGVTATTFDGTLTEISETSTTSEQGIFYTVKGQLHPSKEFNSRYGLTGELSLIVGKKTYWQQIKDTLLNQE